MFKIISLGFCLTIFASAAHAATLDKPLSKLLAEYLALQAQETEHERFLDPTSGSRFFRLARDKSAVIATQTYQKQVLLEQIYKQAVLELRGKDSSREIVELLLYGVIPGMSDKVIPSVTRLTSPRALFEVIYVLLQREDPVSLIALELLQFAGVSYPSTENFAQGLAFYTASVAGDAKKFDAAIEAHEKLYKLIEKYPGFVIGNIGAEISKRGYDPESVANLSGQIAKRRGYLRDDLINGLAKIMDVESRADFCGYHLKTAASADAPQKSAP